MPIQPLSVKDLPKYQQQLAETNTAEDSFAVIIDLFGRLAINEAQLEKLNFAITLLEAEREYDNQKKVFITEHQNLKEAYKLIDNRILAVEQKLYLGIPDDLKEMDKLILEQETIVADQERLNQDEKILLEKMSQVDIKYGKQLAGLDQSRTNRELPLNAKLERQILGIKDAIKNTSAKSRLVSISAVLLLSIVLDGLSFSLGLNEKIATGLIFSHYIFLISLIALLFFFADSLKHKLSLANAKKQCLTFFDQISGSLVEIEGKRKKMEINYQINIQDILDLDLG